MHLQGRVFAAITALAMVSAGTARATETLTGNFTADNFIFAYLSTSASSLGTLIGSGSNWGQAYALTATALTVGKTYYLNIEAINGDTGNYSAGGFIGSFQLSGAATFANGTSQLSTAPTNWTASYNDSNNSDTAQPWVQPTGTVVSEGANGIGPWGTISGVSSSADWIWSTGSLSGDGSAAGDQCAACTVDFQTVIQTVAPVPEADSRAMMAVGILGLAGALHSRGLKRRRDA